MNISKGKPRVSDDGKVSLREERVSVAKEGAVTHHSQQVFSAPYPPPAILEGYERLVPGAATRILGMAESEMRHQQEIERESLRTAGLEVKRGQYLAFIIGISSLSASLIALWMGAPVVSGVIGGSTVVGLVSVFVVGRRMAKNMDGGAST